MVFNLFNKTYETGNIHINERFKESLYNALLRLNKIYLNELNNNILENSIDKLLLKETTLLSQLKDERAIISKISIAISKDKYKDLFKLLSKLTGQLDSKLTDNIIFIGTNKRDISKVKNEITCIFQYIDESMIKHTFELDFILKDFVIVDNENYDDLGNKQNVTSLELNKWEQFINYYNIEDYKKGIFYKAKLDLLKAIIESNEINGIFSNANCTYDFTKIEPTYKSLFTFSKNGLKKEWKIKLCSGLEKEINGIFVYEKDGYITQNLEEISKLIFKKNIKMDSFVSLIDEIKKMNPDYQNKIIIKFYDIIYNKKYNRNENTDKQIKNDLVNYINKTLLTQNYFNENKENLTILTSIKIEKENTFYENFNKNLLKEIILEVKKYF